MLQRGGRREEEAQKDVGTDQYTPSDSLSLVGAPAPRAVVHGMGLTHCVVPTRGEGGETETTSSKQNSRRKHAVIVSPLLVQGFLSLWGNPHASALSRST